jgi:hypothetical protein
MKAAPHLILLTGLISGLVFGQEPPRPPSPPSPSDGSVVPAPTPGRPPRPRQEGDRPRPEGDRPHPEGDRARPPREFDRQGPDSDRPRPRGSRPQRPGEDPPFPGGPNDPTPPPPEDRPPRPGHRPPPAARLTEKLQPYLGVITRNAPPELTAQIRQPDGFGLIIEDILPDSPAQAAGLQRNDLLLRFDDQLLAHPIQLEALVRRTGKDKEAALTLLRAGAEQKVTLKVGEKMLPERRPGPPPGGFPGGFPRPSAPQHRGESNEPRNPVERQVETGGPSGSDSTVRYAPERARIVRQDSEGQYELSQADGTRTLIARDVTGKVTWQGPVGTAEQRKAMPTELREKLKMLEAARPPKGRGPENGPPVQ